MLTISIKKISHVIKIFFYSLSNQFDNYDGNFGEIFKVFSTKFEGNRSIIGRLNQLWPSFFLSLIGQVDKVVRNSSIAVTIEEVARWISIAADIWSLVTSNEQRRGRSSLLCFSVRDAAVPIAWKTPPPPLTTNATSLGLIIWWAARVNINRVQGRLTAL